MFLVHFKNQILQYIFTPIFILHAKLTPETFLYNIITKLLS